MTEKLIGADDVSLDVSNSLNYFVLSRFTAEKSGNVTEIRVKVSDSVNVKYAIYADNAGEPGALLNCQNTGQACAAGWNTLAITSTAVVKDTAYWLGFNSDDSHVGAHSAAGVRRFKVATYAGFTFPDPAGTGFTSDTTYYDILAGWGTVVVAKANQVMIIG